MWKTRDLTLVTFLAVAGFVYSVLVGQLGNFFTGIAGLNFFFIFGHAILISFGFLMYEGRRWRFFLQGALVALLTIPTFQSGAPFDVLARIPMVVNSFFIDTIFNSFYTYFKIRKRLALWSILVNVGFLLLSPFFYTLNMTIFYPPEVLRSFMDIYLLLLPVSLTEAVIGAHLGTKVYFRITKQKRNSFERKK